MKFRPVTLFVLLALVFGLSLASCTMPGAPNAPEENSTLQPENLTEDPVAAMNATATAMAAEVVTTEPTLETLPPVTEVPLTPEIPLETPTEVVMTLQPVETLAPTGEATLPPVLTEQPTVAPATAEAPVVAGGPTTHVVQAGENLFRIALRYGVSLETVARANNIVNPAQIYVGQKLTIPAAGTTPPPGTATPPPTTPGTGNEIVYTVQPGDNLFRIALRYNMNYFYLAQYNGITNVNNLYAGQKIRIPVRP